MGWTPHLREEALEPRHGLLLILRQQPQRALQLEALVHAPHKVPEHDARRIHLRGVGGGLCGHSILVNSCPL